MTEVSFLLVVSGLLSFAWARRFFFKKTDDTPKARNGLGPMGTITGILVVVHFFLPQPHVGGYLFYLACLLLIVSQLFFWWTVVSFSWRGPGIAFTPGAPTQLNTSGPYKYVRHPFYSSYIIFWLGGWLLFLAWDVAVMVVVLSFIYYSAARAEESCILGSELAEAYKEYRGAVGMFLPRLG